MTRIEFDAARANLDNLLSAATVAFSSGSLTGHDYVALTLDIAQRRAALVAAFSEQN